MVAAFTLVALGPPSAAAVDEDPLGEVLGSVTEDGGGVAKEAEVSAGRDSGARVMAPSSPPPPSSDDDLAGHETADPAPPDHGRATVVDADVAGEDVATVGDNTATVEDDDSTSADSTLVAIGGEEVMGTHAASDGEKESHFGDPLAPLCEGSQGQVCLRILYADAWANDDGATSSSRSRSGVAEMCLGGDDATQDTDCSGPVAAGAATSEAEAERDQRRGRTTARSESDVADLCIERDPVTGACAVGVGALHSSGSSDSGGATASADRESYLLRLDLDGEERGRAGDPEALALPPECPDGQSLLCLFLNQGESYVGNGVAGHAQESLHVDVLPGNLDLLVEVGRTDTLVHKDGGEIAGVGQNRPAPTEGRAGGAGQVAGVDEIAGPSGVLPDTGGVWTGLLALAFAGIGIGSMLMGRQRLGVPA